MTFAQSISTCFRKYFTFSGRALRSEFWWFMLFYVIVGISAGVLDAAIFGFNENDQTPISSIFYLLMFFPMISVHVRRLHDVGRSGWWYWLGLIPLIGWIVEIYWLVSRGSENPNAYGMSPLFTSAGVRRSGQAGQTAPLSSEQREEKQQAQNDNLRELRQRRTVTKNPEGPTIQRD